jgi:hypothetical protein
MVYFGQVCLVSWRLPVPEWVNLFFGKFSVIILLNTLHIHLLAPLLLFNAHDSQVWSFNAVAELLHIPFVALELLDEDFFCFFFNSFWN